MTMPGSLPPDPESVSNGQLYLLIDQVRAQLQSQREHDARQATMVAKRMEDLTGEVAMARRETAEMVDLWKSGKTIVAMFKLAGLLATAGLALAGLWSLMKGVPLSGSIR